MIKWTEIETLEPVLNLGLPTVQKLHRWIMDGGDQQERTMDESHCSSCSPCHLSPEECLTLTR